MKADPPEWLLSEDNHAVRYFILKDILGKRENDENGKVKERDYAERWGARFWPSKKAEGTRELQRISMSKLRQWNSLAAHGSGGA